MTSTDKAAIGWSIGIVILFVGIAFATSASDSSTPTAAPSTPSMDETKSDPFADEVAAVQESATEKTQKTGWERLESSQDPGIGHETHQLAIILPPSDKVYSGTLKYDATEPIQLVSLHGSLAAGEDNGQAIWTPDGETKFALTFVDSMKSKGEWQFAGNALAVHTMNPTPFVVDYQVDYEEKPMSETVITGTTSSVQDPGLGHESHQLAVLLAPSSDVYSGILSYSASEPIQLVSLDGPIDGSERPAMTWTPDGEAIFALTFVDPNNAMGSWEFSGNALAVHTMFPAEFTVSYSVSATTTLGQTMMMEKPAAPAEPQTVTVTLPVGTSVPGCEETNECFVPASITINAGDTVSWDNVDTAAHTVTSGTLEDGFDGTFDSSLLMGGKTFEVTFDESGSYDYFCIVHPWMVGDIQVN